MSAKSARSERKQQNTTKNTHNNYLYYHYITSCTNFPGSRPYTNDPPPTENAAKHNTVNIQQNTATTHVTSSMYFRVDHIYIYYTHTF